MPKMEWGDNLVQGLAPMDATHQEFVECYNALAEADADSFLVRLDEFMTHTVKHFDQENAWMEKVGFPGCHKAEHDRVLAVLRQVRDNYEKGDVFFGKQLVEELPVWFESHANGMDAALAFHIETIGFDTETGEIRHPEKLGGESGESASCTSGGSCH